MSTKPTKTANSVKTAKNAKTEPSLLHSDSSCEDTPDHDSSSSVVDLLDMFFRDSMTGANVVETIGYAVQSFGEKINEHNTLAKQNNAIQSQHNRLLKEQISELKQIRLLLHKQSTTVK